MQLLPFFKSVLEQDRASVVLCDLEHTIIYMNPAAKVNYIKYGGEKLIGQNLLLCHNEDSQIRIRKIIQWFSESIENNIIFTTHSNHDNKDIYMVALRDEKGNLIGYYEKHEYRTVETALPYQKI